MADYGGIIAWNFVIDCRNRSRIPPYNLIIPPYSYFSNGWRIYSRVLAEFGGIMSMEAWLKTEEFPHTSS
jgi:hypothetical protein